MNLCYIDFDINLQRWIKSKNLEKKFAKLKIICISTVIFDSLVRVWGSKDTTLSRTFFGAVSEQFFSDQFFSTFLNLQVIK